MARTNVKVPTAPIFTHEGATAARINPEQQLRRSVLACFLFESNFYEDGQSVADRITSSVSALLKTKGGAKKVADLAREARSKFKLRHVPLHLVNALVAAQTPEARAVIAPVLADVIQRPDEISEFISQYWKNGKKSLPNQVKKGLAAAFQKFNEWSLGKYANRDGAVSLRDALFLVHAKPKDAEQASVFKKLANKELKAPEESWEVQLSSGADKKATFTELFTKGTGAMATLRNLRNAIQSGVDDKVIRHALANIKTERVLPFRFITAAKYAPKFEPELETAMFKCLEGYEKLPGKTLLLVDNSGSMHPMYGGGQVSAKSELSRIDAACALAMLVREVCEDVQILVFSDDAKIVRPRRGFALRDEILKEKVGGTDIGRAVKVAKSEGYDRIIVLTDEQTAARGVYNKSAVPDPLPGTKGYFINVANYQNGVGYGAWVNISGWSESILEFIAESEKQLV